MSKLWNRKKLEILWTAAALVGAAMAGGCQAHAYVRPAVPHGKLVVVQKGHVHSRSCGHFKYRGKWYFVRGHVHGESCGHIEVKRVWVLG